MKISIITASFNNGQTLGDTVASVQAQTYDNWEHLLIDGQSSDHTLEVARQAGGHFARIVSGPDKGIFDALNKGIALARGDIISILHADDLYAGPYVLEHVARLFAQTKANGVYGDLVYVRARHTGQIVRYWKAGPYKPAQLAQGWMPPHPALFLRRTLYEKYGGFDQNYTIAADYELMMRMLGKYHISLAYLPEVLVRMRMGGASNKSISNIFRKMREDYQAMRSLQTGNWRTLARKTLSKLHQFVRR